MRLFLLFICLFHFSMVGAQIRCGSDQLLKINTEQNAQFIQDRLHLEQRMHEWAIKNKAQTNSIISIPVVFHVLYNTEEQNISDQQLLSQLDVLNADFQRTNIDAINTPADFIDVAADASFEFCLAMRDPENNTTTGITRTNTSIDGFSLNDNRIYYDSLGGKNGWSRDKYLNIWISKLNGVLGFASFPAGGIQEKDGLVIDYEHIGTIGTAVSPFHKGRTTTHELGHWLNLIHPWGDGNCADDFVADTPTQESENYGCPAHPSPSCSNQGDMFQNFMDYTNDACMNLFTEGQKERMHAAFNTYRNSLLTSNACILPLEDAGISAVSLPNEESPYCGSTIEAQISLTNYSSLTLDSVTIICVDENENSHFTYWHGSLAAGATTSVTLNEIPLIDGSHEWEVYTLLPDGAPDINTANDSYQLSFTSFDGQSVNLSITTDNYGAENYWEITDENGTIWAQDSLLSSNTTIDTSLCLDPNNCFTLTIYDLYNDGMCCDFGNGNIVVNGNSFSGEFQSSLAIDLCSLNNISTSEHIPVRIYPNPTDGMITIEGVSEESSIQLYNTFGTLLLHKKGEKSLDLKAFSNGVYFLSINTDKKIITRKLIINK